MQTPVGKKKGTRSPNPCSISGQQLWLGNRRPYMTAAAFRFVSYCLKCTHCNLIIEPPREYLGDSAFFISAIPLLSVLPAYQRHGQVTHTLKWLAQPICCESKCCSEATESSLITSFQWCSRCESWRERALLVCFSEKGKR